MWSYAHFVKDPNFKECSEYSEWNEIGHRNGYCNRFRPRRSTLKQFDPIEVNSIGDSNM